MLLWLVSLGMNIREHCFFSTGIWRQLNWDVNICELCFVGVVCEHVFLETSLIG